MNSRERMLAAMDLRPVDRVPTDIWATGEVWAKLRDHFGEDTDIRAELYIDGMTGIGPEYVGPPLPEMPEGESVDFWGIRRKQVEYYDGIYNEQSLNPLADAETIADLNDYRWPTTDWFDYSGMPAAAEEVHDKKVVQCGYMAPFYYHNLLRGLEQSLMDPVLDPDLTHEVVQRISDFFYDHHRRMFEEAGELIDVAQVTDDLGSQTGPLISMELYEEFYAPHHKRFIDLCHEFDIKVFHHDDGSCRAFLPLLIEMGIDVLNPVQWTCADMDMKKLKEEFGNKICFHGAVENQNILPFGSPTDVRKEVRHCIDSLASDGTGYILAPCHNLQPNTPIENILAMYDEALSYGKMS
ncbi:MAG: uroporphyrinogen decarboxylase family protein [Candidatus Brocadiia bacterium]